MTFEVPQIQVWLLVIGPLSQPAWVEDTLLHIAVSARGWSRCG